MARFERTLTIDHEIGPSGELRIRTVDGSVRLRGTDGPNVHVVATYNVRASDEAAADRAIESAEIRVERMNGRLEIDTRERWWSPFDVLGQLLSGTRVRVDFDVEVPRGASVQVDGVSAEVSAQGLAGRQRYKTVSGDMTSVDAAGIIDADSVSGRIEVFGPSAIGLRAHSVSGRVRAAALELLRVEVGTTSGGVDLAGRLVPGVPHSINTVSGGVRLATDAGVTVELRTMSGGVRSQVPNRIESTNGGRRVVVGDGSARLRIQSVSGGLEVMPQGVTQAAPDAGASTTAGGAWTPTYATAGTAGTTAPSAESPAVTQPEASAGTTEPATEERRNGSGQPAEDLDLETLRALERGEIGVEEAAARLRRRAEPPREQVAGGSPTDA